MRSRYGYFLLAVAVCLVALASASCNKEGGKAEDKAAASEKSQPESNLLNIAKQAADVVSLDDEFAEARRIVEGAGFVVKEYANFPASEVTTKGRVLVYTDKKGKESGGVIYVMKSGYEVAPGWHWYFEDLAPDSVSKVEINKDGLWDVRIVSTRGKVEQFIQDEAFTLSPKARKDWIAMNGTSSPPVSSEKAMWKCFDGDTTTVWESPLSGGAFIEFEVPFGVQNGNLSICTTATGQPRQCTVYADGKEAQRIELQQVAGRQMIALGEGVKGAKKIRLEFTSTQGNAGVVDVAELGLN